MNGNTFASANMQTVFQTVEYCFARYGINRIVLAGLQPLLNDELLEFVSKCRRLGIGKVSFTSHGLGLLDWIERLRDVGLTDVTLSVQNFSRQQYVTHMV